MGIDPQAEAILEEGRRRLAAGDLGSAADCAVTAGHVLNNSALGAGPWLVALRWRIRAFTAEICLRAGLPELVVDDLEPSALTLVGAGRQVGDGEHAWLRSVTAAAAALDEVELWHDATARMRALARREGDPGRLAEVDAAWRAFSSRFQLDPASPGPAHEAPGRLELILRARAQLHAGGSFGARYAEALAERVLAENPMDRASQLEALAVLTRACLASGEQAGVRRHIFLSRAVVHLIAAIEVLRREDAVPGARRPWHRALARLVAAGCAVSEAITDDPSLRSVLTVNDLATLIEAFLQGLAFARVDGRDPAELLGRGEAMLYLVGLTDPPRLVAVRVGDGGDAAVDVRRWDADDGTLSLPEMPCGVASPCSHLMVFRSGWAYQLPAELLPLPGTGVEDRPLISYHRCAREVASKRTPTARAREALRILLVAPLVDGIASVDQPAPWTFEAEVAGLRALWRRRYPGTQRVLLGDEVTGEALRRHAADADLIHIISHGAIRDGAAVLQLRDGGVIHAGELASLRLDAAPLVFLHACWVGLACATGGGGRDLISVLRHTGARAVIASQRPVPSEFAPPLALLFYEQLLSAWAGWALARALTRLRSTAYEIPAPEDWEDPEVAPWLNYELHGDPWWWWRT